MKFITLSKRLLFCLLAASVLGSQLLNAHEGHVHAEVPTDSSGDVGGIITVTEQGKRNLGIKVVEAEIVELENTIEAIVEIKSIPTRTGVLSSRIPGKIKKIYTPRGKPVLTGDPMVVIESFQPGNPPPSATYRSPISGTVTHWDAEVGESVEPNGHLAEVVDLSEVYAEITLFEGQVNQVSVGQTVRVNVVSFPDKYFESKIELISGKLDPETRVLKVYARIDNKELLLRPHMRGIAHVVTENLDAVIGIPHEAITGDPANLSAFVQLDDQGLQYEQRQIVVGSKNDRITEVLEGVLPGEQVVVSGNYQLQFVEGKPKEIPDGGDHGHAHEDDDDHHHSASSGRSSLLNWPIFFVMAIALLVSVIANVYYALQQKKSR